MNGLVAWLAFYFAFLTWSSSATALALLVATLAPQRVERSARAMRGRPRSAWLMGFLQLWVVLAMLGNSAGRPLLGLLALTCAFGSVLAWAAGLAAAAANLGLALLGPQPARPYLPLLAGAALLFGACCFPVLGQGALVLLSVECLGATTLGHVMRLPSGEGEPGPV